MATVTYESVRAASPGAIAYACTRLGFRVFPLRSDTLTPSFTGWPERATTDLGQVRAWWTGEYASSGVGIATGPESGTWVLDIDVKEVDGFASLRELCARHHCGVEPFVNTMVVRTPSGGAHVYFRWNEAAGTEGGIRNSAKALMPGLDVRGIRGYTRAPGLFGYTIVERSGIRSVAMDDAPDWLTPLCKRRRSSARDAPTNADVRARMSAGSADMARAQAAHAVRMLRNCPPGTRNDTLNRTAFKLGTLSALHGYPSEDVARESCLAALSAAGANDSLDQQTRTFASGWEAGRAAESGTKMTADRRSSRTEG